MSHAPGAKLIRIDNMQLELFNDSKSLERPSAEHELAYDLFIGNATDSGAARIHRNRAMVAHDENSAFGHLIRQFDITFP